MSWKEDIKNSIMALAGTAELKHKPDIYYATVDMDNPYNIATRTCSCTLISGKSDLNLSAVSLMAEINDGILVLPSPGSTVIIAKAAHSDPYVVMFSQIDQVFYVAGDNTLLIDKTSGIALTTSDDTITLTTTSADITVTTDSAKITLTTGDDGTAIVQQGEMAITLNGGMINIKNGSVNFTTIMQNILTHLISLIVATGTGPASLDPSTVANLNSDLSDLNQILN